MEDCMIYHTGVYQFAEGVLKDNTVYFKDKDGNLCFPKEIFMAIEECEGGLIQFEVKGKWGIADIHTGKIKINPIWDYVGPFYNGYAHVAIEAKVDCSYYHDIRVYGGKHGYIDETGKSIVPLEYDDGNDIPYSSYFEVAKNSKWGMIDKKNRIIIPLKWDFLERCYGTNLIFCGLVNPQENTIDWGVYDKKGNLIVEPKLSKKPVPYTGDHKNRLCINSETYYILESEEKYGVLSSDGELMHDTTLSKYKVEFIINELLK